MSDKPKLRIGLLLDSLQVPAWTRAMLELIEQSADAEIALVVLDANDEPRPKRSRLSTLLQNRSSLLYIAYGKLDRRKFRRFNFPDATEQTDIADLLADVPVVKVKPKRTKFSDRFGQSDVETIRGHDLDVLVRLGFRILRGGILQAARCGVWSFHHGDNRVNRGGPPCFWEVIERQPVTGSILQILNEDLDAGTVLCRSYSATDPVSVHRNRCAVLWKSLHFLPRMLKRLRRMGKEAFFERVAEENAAPNLYSNRLYTQPANWELAGPLLRHLLHRAKNRLRKEFRFDQWCLGFRFGDDVSTSCWRLKQIVPPKDRFWADPHVVRANGRYYIFIEEFIYAADRAHISVIEMDGRGNHGPPKKVLAPPHHLSYPLVFKHEGDWYMIPESHRGIDAYKCTRFPDCWEFHHTLMSDVSGSDATLLEHGGRWWLFVDLAAGRGCSSWDELFLFHADRPLSTDWTPHADNPIVSDVRRARPAGKIFEHNGRLYRPAQDCSGGYGYGMRIHEILALTPTEYAEREIARVEPNWHKSISGVHHFSREGRLTVIDFKLVRSRLGTGATSGPS